ncbi:MAG: hypothetical protein IOD12_17425 [Silvanigrellales bacterium]|nr:hypothetical protein [Silvanigrellales bacterium]
MKKILPAVLLSALAVAAHSCGKANETNSRVLERWNSANEPDLMNVGVGLERTLSKLPLSARMKTKPWSDSYWPSNKGGIAARWNPVDPQPFRYTSPSLSELKNMSRDALAALSPAEKYDVLMGRYDYPTVKSERARTSPDNEDWEGICHGWAPAAQLFEEPLPVSVNNADGIAVPFGSSDVKALLSYYQGQIARDVPTRFLASRCNVDLSTSPDAARRIECRDVNAGAFHIVLANLVSKNQPFVADVTRDLQVWNQPIYAYDSVVQREQPPSPGAAPGTVKEVVVKTRMVYGVEISPEWRALGNGQALAEKNYQYRLELSVSGEILGGEWLTDERPDFLWSQGQPTFRGYFSKLGDLHKASLGGGAPVPTPQPVPTAVVTPQPVPTAVVTPQPVPTAVVTPQPVPTAVVTPQPVVTVLPLPTRTPLPPDRLGSFCPAGWDARTVPGSTSATYCAQGSKVLGPMSDELLNACLMAFHSDCYEPNWNEATYLKFRGTAVCLPGTTFDNQSGYCAQNDATGSVSVFGPFSKELVERCEKAQGGEACLTMRWNRDFVLSLMVL